LPGDLGAGPIFRSRLKQLLFAFSGGLLSGPTLSEASTPVASYNNLSTSNVTPSAMAALRAATWPAHQRLERQLDVKTRFSNAAAYRAHLEKMWGFCAAVEPRLGAHLFGDALSDYDGRRKLPLLASDLTALGVAPASVELLPRCASLPACGDTSAAFGCAYVLEGATLGGRTLLPLVQSRLGHTAQHGARFLASYGEHTLTNWRAFGSALDAWCSTTARAAGAAAAAVATFESLECWLCGGAA
jgi:heme oxygenase